MFYIRRCIRLYGVIPGYPYLFTRILLTVHCMRHEIGLAIKEGVPCGKGTRRLGGTPTPRMWW